MSNRQLDGLSSIQERPALESNLGTILTFVLYDNIARTFVEYVYYHMSFKQNILLL